MLYSAIYLSLQYFYIFHYYFHIYTLCYSTLHNHDNYNFTQTSRILIPIVMHLKIYTMISLYFFAGSYVFSFVLIIAINQLIS